MLRQRRAAIAPVHVADDLRVRVGPAVDQVERTELSTVVPARLPRPTTWITARPPVGVV